MSNASVAPSRTNGVTVELNKNTILITGGGSGIGFALATRFAQAGSEVIICGRRPETLAEAKQHCPALVTLPCDVSQETDREKLFELVKRDFPKLNVLINNAGIQNRPPSLINPQDWRRHRSER